MSSGYPCLGVYYPTWSTLVRMETAIRSKLIIKNERYVSISIKMYVILPKGNVIYTGVSCDPKKDTRSTKQAVRAADHPG